MRVVATIRLAFDADSYGEAGQIIDTFMTPTKGSFTSGSAKGHADVVAFETRPCKHIEFDRVENRLDDVERSLQAEAGMPTGRSIAFE